MHICILDQRRTQKSCELCVFRHHFHRPIILFWFRSFFELVSAVLCFEVPFPNSCSMTHMNEEFNENPENQLYETKEVEKKKYDKSKNRKQSNWQLKSHIIQGRTVLCHWYIYLYVFVCVSSYVGCTFCNVWCCDSLMTS